MILHVFKELEGKHDTAGFHDGEFSKSRLLYFNCVFFGNGRLVLSVICQHHLHRCHYSCDYDISIMTTVMVFLLG